MYKPSKLKLHLRYSRHHRKKKRNHTHPANLVTFLIYFIYQLMIIIVSSLYQAHLKLLIRFTHHSRDLKIELYLW